jgi:haloalkane dehalogenase
VLLQHGNPTWSFLWRKVIWRLEEQGLRIIAPDLLGLGLSSKPRDPSVHTLDRHAELISALIRALDLRDLVVVGQDWGGPIAATAAARNADRVRGAVFANTAVRQPKKPPRTTAFHRLAHTPVVSDLLFHWLNGVVLAMPFAQGDRSSIGWDELKAYWWPLRRLADRAAPLALARMVPLSLDHPTVETLGEADAWARGFDGPVRLVWGTRDPILGPALKGMQQLFDDAIVFKTDAGHFLQEEVPAALAHAIVQVAEAVTASQNE